MASIRERNGRFTAIVRKARHPTISKTFASKRKAENWAASMEGRIEDGEAFDTTQKYTLSDAVTRYIDDPGRSKTNYQRMVLNWWAETAMNRQGMSLGKKKLQSLRRSDFVDARDQLRELTTKDSKPVAAATVNRRMSAISAVLTEAQQWDWLRENVARLKRLPGEVKRTRLLSADEQRSILEAARSSDEPCMFAFVVCAMSSGARAGELIGLLWKDVDSEAGLARLTHTKNGTNRPIPLRGLARDLLREMKATEKVADIRGDGYVFKNKSGHAPFYYRKAWGELRDAAKVGDVRFHDLRHLAASHLAMAGATQRELMEVLGHKSASMTRRYSHFFDQHVAELGDRLQARLFGDADK